MSEASGYQGTALGMRRVPANLPFFVLCFIYLWLVVEPHLIYYCFGTVLPNAPQFATGWSFLRDSFAVPGGPVAYVSGFLSQGYYYAWLGAAIIVLAGIGLAGLFRRHLISIGFTWASALAGLPAIAFFLICARYKHPLPLCLAVSLGLLLSLVFERLPLRRPPARIVACCLLAVVGFWLGGGGTFLLFVLMTVVYAVLVHKDWRTVALVLPASVAIAWALAEYLFLLPARQTFLILTPFEPWWLAGADASVKVLTCLLYGFVPAAVLIVLVARGLFGGRRQKPAVRSKKAKGRGKRDTARRKKPFAAIVAGPVLSAVPVVLMALGLYLGYDELRKPYVLSNYYSCQKRWDEIIELSRRLPRDRSNAFVSHDIIRALYHTGRLPYDMFCFPLVPEGVLLTHEKRESDLTQCKLSDIFLELGHVNMAEKLASELVATKGHLGVALEKLGWIGIIKGQPATARVYLRALKRDPIRRGRAESLLHGLDNGFAGDRAAYIDRVRSCMQDETGGVTGSEPVDETLAALFERNPRNKMAFEYLMACYLLTGRVDRIAQNVARLRDLGYQEIPTLYQEAILIDRELAGRTIDLAGFSISQETLRRYEAFSRILSAMQPHNRQAVLNRLIRDFGTTYFFYYSFGRVGLV